MFDEGNAERDANWEGTEILFLARFMLVTKRKGVRTSVKKEKHMIVYVINTIMYSIMVSKNDFLLKYYGG